MYSTVGSLGLLGIDPYTITVEVDVRRGLPGFDIVGLPDAAVKESRDRVKSAIQNLGYGMPQSKIVANLAPADTRKAGSVYDLPLLLALLHACGYEELATEGAAVIGEIGLSGEIRPVRGVLPMVLEARRLGFQRVIVPADNAGEAVAAEDVEVLCAAHARDVVAYFKGEQPLPVPREAAKVQKREVGAPLPDLSEVRGQEEAKRALEIAAAGGHNLLLVGPPGTGKSMLARRLPSVLPPMERREAVDVTKIYSVAGMLGHGGLLERRPFRAPHHTVSAAALTGGGQAANPGEVSLAHNGVLFLDELPEFNKMALEVLRQPLEDGMVSIARVRQRVTYPSKVMLVAAMNPCPCGYKGHPTKACTCTPLAAQRYIGRVSGPLLDRIDIHVEVLPVEYRQLSGARGGESSGTVRRRVVAARKIQQERFAGAGISCNAEIPPSLLREVCNMEPAADKMLGTAFERMGLSARGYDRILKVARTIADLEGAAEIAASHIAQALQLRGLDRKYWGN